MSTTTTTLVIVAVARDGQKMARIARGWFVPVWVITTYVARARRDGVVTWRRGADIGRSASGRRPSDRLIDEAMALAAARGLAYDGTVRHGDRVAP